MFLISTPDKASEAIARTQWSLLRPYLRIIGDSLGEGYRSTSNQVVSYDDYETSQDVSLLASIRGIYTGYQDDTYEIELNVNTPKAMHNPSLTWVELSIRELNKVGLNGFKVTMTHDYNESTKLDRVKDVLNTLAYGGLSFALLENVFNYDIDFEPVNKSNHIYAVSRTVSDDKVNEWIPVQSADIQSDTGGMIFNINCLLPPLVKIRKNDEETTHVFDQFLLRDMLRMDHNLLDNEEVMGRVLQVITPKEETTQGE